MKKVYIYDNITDNMARLYSRRISCIWIQVTQMPKDPISQIEFPQGTRLILNKKKFPYLYKYGYLRFKRKSGLCKLYQDEIEVIVEKRYEEHLQKNLPKD